MIKQSGEGQAINSGGVGIMTDLRQYQCQIRIFFRVFVLTEISRVLIIFSNFKCSILGDALFKGLKTGQPSPGHPLPSSEADHRIRREFELI